MEKGYYWTRDCAGCDEQEIPLGHLDAFCQEQMKTKGGEFGECTSKQKHDFLMSLLDDKSLPFCNLKFGAVRDWKKVNMISNHLNYDAKGGMPTQNFINMLRAENLFDSTGIDEISRFCIVDEDDVFHYSNMTDANEDIIFPTEEKASILKQKLSLLSNI